MEDRELSVPVNLEGEKQILGCEGDTVLPHDAGLEAPGGLHPPVREDFPEAVLRRWHHLSQVRLKTIRGSGSLTIGCNGQLVVSAKEGPARAVFGEEKGYSSAGNRLVIFIAHLHHQLLNVNTVQGENTEIFPLRKGTRVATANGGRKRLSQLTPGTNVLIYYEQRGDRRTVKQIVVLGAAPAKDKKASPPPS